MGSESREVRLRQKERTEKELETRLAALTARGIDTKKIDKDPTVRALRAEVKQSKKRLAAIDAREALTQSLAERKAQKAAEPKKKKKSKKAAEREAKAAGESKKKKKKQQKLQQKAK